MSLAEAFEFKTVPLGSPFMNEEDQQNGCHWIFTGPTKVGKTYAAFYMLANWLPRCDEYYAMCPTADAQDIYKSVRWTKLYDRFDEQLIDEVLTKAKLRSKAGVRRRIAVLIDDVLGENDMKRADGPMVRLFTTGRHYGIYAIAISQRCSGFHPNIRGQSGYVVFRTGKASDVEGIYDECGVGTKKEFNALMRSTWKTERRPYIRDHHHNRYFVGYDVELMPRSAEDIEEIAPAAPDAAPETADSETTSSDEAEGKQQGADNVEESDVFADLQEADMSASEDEATPAVAASKSQKAANKFTKAAHSPGAA